MNADTPLIELQGIGRGYKGKRGAPVIALKDVSLCVYSGEFLCITGPSGSGKTTLMNILGCLDKSDAGIYRFLGREVQQLGPDGLAWLRRKAFGFVFQNYNLLGSATARQNVEMPGAYAGLAPVPCRIRALHLLAGLGLENRTGHRPAALSGGEQQRVSIARALMNGGRVILADEPTGSLDSKNGEQVLRLLQDLANKGHTIVLVTHNPEIAARADRRIELRDGRLVEDSECQAKGGIFLLPASSRRAAASRGSDGWNVPGASVGAGLAACQPAGNPADACHAECVQHTLGCVGRSYHAEYRRGGVSRYLGPGQPPGSRPHGGFHREARK